MPVSFRIFAFFLNHSWDVLPLFTHQFHIRCISFCFLNCLLVRVNCPEQQLREDGDESDNNIGCARLVPPIGGRSHKDVCVEEGDADFEDGKEVGLRCGDF
mmetsp:Transcript_77042/g.152663  ORF Transcript_77042/g.152663 Transcript_77042/m.152663 type:complete len:101 (-) Transcript_77042:260-562(-)